MRWSNKMSKEEKDAYWEEVKVRRQPYYERVREEKRAREEQTVESFSKRKASKDDYEERKREKAKREQEAKEAARKTRERSTG